MNRFSWPVRFFLALTIGCAVLLASSALVSPKSIDEQRYREFAESSRLVDALVKRFGPTFAWTMWAKGNVVIMVDGIAKVDAQDEIRDWLIAEKARMQMMSPVTLEFYAKGRPPEWPFHDLLRTCEF